MVLKNIYIYALVGLFALVAVSTAHSTTVLTEYSDKDAGFSLQYPDQWVLVKTPDEMIKIQDGSIDLVNEKNMTKEERGKYKLLIHVDGSPKYLSNVAILVTSIKPDGKPAYDTASEAVEAVNEDFKKSKSSGTFELGETYFGESHSYMYQKFVNVKKWNDRIRITYYLAASVSNAYMMIETRLEGAIDSEKDNDFNQVIQSFRVTANESGKIDPSLGWGSFKPGENTAGNAGSPDVNKQSMVEDFVDNSYGWPESTESSFKDGRYELNSIGKDAFIATTKNFGTINFDFSYEGSYEFIDGDKSAGFGLVFGYKDKENYLAFLVTPAGGVLVIEKRDGKINELVPWTTSPSAIGEKHTLMVQGDYQPLPDGAQTYRYSLLFFIDGMQVANVVYNDVVNMNGNYGLFVSENVHVAFDWLISRNYLLDSVMTLDRLANPGS